MLVKSGFPHLLPTDVYPNLDTFRTKELTQVFATECLHPRKPCRNLAPLPEGKECSSMEFRRCKLVKKQRRRRQWPRLPALPESDEN